MAKIVMIICTLVVSCLCSTEEKQSNYRGLITFILRDQKTNVADWVVSACKKDNSDIGEEQEDEIREAVKCLSRDSATNLTEVSKCAEVLKTRVESCLEQKYLPQFLLDYATESVNQGYAKFMSDSFDAFENCGKKLISEPVDRVIRACVAPYDNGIIPSTKAEFCKLLIAASKCPTDGVKNNCDLTLTVTEVINKYHNIFENIC